MIRNRAIEGQGKGNAEMKCILCVVSLALLSSVYAAGPDAGARERLTRAVEGARELAAKAQESEHADALQPVLYDDRKDLPPKRFPTKRDARVYSEQRPWVQQYLVRLSTRYQTVDRTDPGWPRPEDASALRALLTDPDSAVRGLAAEALATLHDPDDVPRIAKLLDDRAESVQALGWNHILSATLPLPRAPAAGEDDSRVTDIERGWQPRQVRGYARAALTLMTGQELDSGNFEKWWERNKGGRTCVWYWRERLHLELAQAEAVGSVDWRDEKDWHQKNPNAPYAEWEKRNRERQAQRLAAVRRAVAQELAGLPAEVEVEVRLLAQNRYSSGLGVSLDEPLMGPFECSRVSSGRLLDLLERKDLWGDVEWGGEEGIPAYNTMAIQLAGRAESFFRPDQVDRLREVQKRERSLWWSGQAALCIGISRLLPPAPDGALNDAATRDGVLRNGVKQLGEVFARGKIARELVRVGLPRNWEFLETEFFAERPQSAIPDLRSSILQELGAEPITGEKRGHLVELLLDKRFEPLWTTPATAGGGDYQHRLDAIRSVNAQAAREVLTDGDDARLRDPAQAAETLKEVLEKVHALAAEPRP